MGRPPADRQPLVLATRNRHKLAEVTRLLAPMGLTVEPLPDGIELPPEDGDTFEANAVPKAQAAAAATGRSAIADDSGIEAAALDGRPGVRSARYAGESATDEENLLKLMDEAPVGSALRYVCALAFVDPSDGEERVFVGECRGRLAGERRGARGFGYDPAFLPDDEDPALAPGAASTSALALAPASGERDGRARTMSELSEAEKDAISHRGRALRAFAEWYLS